MRHEMELMELIQDNLDQVKLLRAQPEVNPREIDDALWRVLGLALELDAVYANKIKEVDEREVVTIKEELFKRQEMVELSNRREETITSMFDRNDPDENSLAELFDDMRKQNQYETTFYESDLKLVQEQLDAIKEADEMVANLKAERQEMENQIAAIRNSVVPFEDFNRTLNEDYDRFVDENNINDINAAGIDDLRAEKTRRLERQAVINRNRQLAETARGIDLDNFSYVTRLTENDYALNEINETLFLFEVGDMFKQEVHSYEELLDKTRKIHERVSARELEGAEIYDMNRPNQISYRTMAFAMDLHNVESQINAPKRIAELEERLHGIDLAIETAYDKVKGRKELDDIINNRKGEYDKVEDQVKAGDEAEAETVEEVQPEVIAPVVENNEPELTENNEEEINQENNLDNVEDADFEVTPNAEEKENVSNDEEQSLVPVDEQAIVPLEEGEFEVKDVKQAKPGFFAKIMEKYGDKLKQIGKIAAAVILAGTILLSTKGIYDINKQKAAQEAIVPPTTIEQVETVAPNVTESEIEKAVDQAVEAYSPTIGDKVHVNEGVQYFRDSSSAQLGQNSYVTGKSGLKEGDYNVNRIALVAKDANGQATGKIIDVTAAPGVSADQLANSLGLPEGNYDVIMHIGKGDADGNYIEANPNVKSPDDLCWIKTDGAYTNGLSLTQASADVLAMNAERGMSR